MANHEKFLLKLNVLCDFLVSVANMVVKKYHH